MIFQYLSLVVAMVLLEMGVGIAAFVKKDEIKHSTHIEPLHLAIAGGVLFTIGFVQVIPLKSVYIFFIYFPVISSAISQQIISGGMMFYNFRQEHQNY